MHTRNKKKGIHLCVMSKWWGLRQIKEVRKIGNIEADGGLETDHFSIWWRDPRFYIGESRVSVDSLYFHHLKVTIPKAN